MPFGQGSGDRSYLECVTDNFRLGRREFRAAVKSLCKLTSIGQRPQQYFRRECPVSSPQLASRPLTESSYLHPNGRTVKLEALPPPGAGLPKMFAFHFQMQVNS
ncbi:MAG: hypothetical protein KatS3mg106_289 [Gemmataceae bacterium]|nr:MAG: hypothetical protein KatS3mg106_289 [Gemmataceae bacterium]